LQIIKEKLKFDNVSILNEETSIYSFLDSLEIIELALEIDKELDVNITDYVIENWQKLGDVAETYLLLSEKK